ncbi:MAG: methylmalonyl Co-A mutase-associated GTPase MeaB [Terriglobales bacterium]
MFPPAEPSDVAAWATAIRAGQARDLARGLTLIENGGPEAEALLKALFPHSGGAALLGITGAPGAGKSTLVSELAAAYRQAGESVGVLAVDPSSPFTHGAILGDRIRMQRHHADTGVFIRSMATRGCLGGLAAATTEAAWMLDASGRRRILIETVGVGQDEVDIAQLADATLLLLVPGMGDEVQALKAGVMEIADIFVINKADRGPERLEQELRAMLSLAHRADGWRPPILATVATEARGIAELQAAVARYLDFLAAEGRGEARRRRRWRRHLERMLRDRAYQTWVAPRLAEADWERMTGEIESRRCDPFTLADEILARR